MNLDNLLNSETGKQLVKTYHSELHENRIQLLDEIASLKQQRNDELTPLNIALDQAASDCVEAQTKLEAAKIRERTADSKVRQAKGAYSIHLTRVEKELIATAPESIDTFCAELKEEIRELQNVGITRTGKLSNARSITLRLEALRGAVNAAQALKLTVVDDIEVEFQQLRDALPLIRMQ